VCATSTRAQPERERPDTPSRRTPEHGEREHLAPYEQQRERGDGQQGGPGVVRVQRDRPERGGRRRDEQHAEPEPADACTETNEQERDEHERGGAAQGHERLECGVVVRCGRGGGWQEDRERAGRILHEEVPVGDVPVEQRLRVALVEVDVAKPSRTKQAPVRDRAGRHEQWDADETRPDCVSRPGRAARQGCSGGAGAVGGGAGVVGGGAGVVGGGGAGFAGFGATWNPSPLVGVVVVEAP